MKKILLLAVIFGSLALYSCGGDDPVTPVTVTISATTPAAIAADGGTATFNITSNADWTIEKVAADEWFSLDPMEGSQNGTVTATVNANAGAERKSVITIKTKTGDKTTTVTLTQSGTSAGTGMTIDDLVGDWDVACIFADDYNERADNMSYTVTFEKVDATNLKIHNFLNFAVFDYETDDTLNATFDPETETISVPVQELTPTFDEDGWPIFLYPFRYETFESCFADKSGFVNLPIVDGKIDFAAGGYTIVDGANGSFVILTKNPVGTDVYYYQFYYINTVFTKSSASAPVKAAPAKNMKLANYSKTASRAAFGMWK